ncbi:mannosyltransferase putative-domain-containing protein [Gamsiella multidivaricata]|uniref:mannosyltransferase putative-domain-containing protein n=1 Tax=Gamsiella multidivaricata TaxID=101098 RepID=UPI00221F50FC|nr:mannosyltransferase putative-domain-containing protein [Gamsiella multidivaricata]KAG0370916.1 hypothetical protein BGZ54_002727 [Gamsiella multidivaricata]KAI7816242.1 mannosyltransferase putative-domain-containing protein [Gamsiella multidivaricata]
MDARVPESFRLPKNVKNRDIMMCVGDKHSIYARTTVKVLREVLESELPIEIYFAGDRDLSKENRQWFQRFDNMTGIDTTTRLDQHLVQISGPMIKPFAMLTSQFYEDPAILFEDGGYKEVGTVFFYDWTVLNKTAGVNKRAWLASSLPSVSNRPSKTPWFRSKGDQTQDSGVIVLNKKKHFLGLLAICKMNDFLERNQAAFQSAWSEKEFWIGMDMTFHGTLMEVEWNLRLTVFEMLRHDQAVAQELNQPKVKDILPIARLVKAEDAKGGKGNNEAV